MAFGGKKATVLLFAGDIAIFVFSLWLTLLVRYFALPSGELLDAHFRLFGILFAVWALVFYMAGLYSKRVLLRQYELTGAILRTQLLNITIAALFFFTVPGIGITPKTNLAVYLLVSLALILVWRLAIFPRITRPSVRERAALLGSGADADELVREVNGNARYRLEFVVVAAPAEVQDVEVFNRRLQDERVTMLVVDTTNEAAKPLLAEVYRLAFLRKQYEFEDLYRVYEEVFDRVPLSLLRYDWFLKNVSRPTLGFYTAVKRLIDLVGGIVIAVATIALTPLIYIAMKLEGPGPVFIAQERYGQYGSKIRCYKFRSMRINKAASSEWTTEEKKDNPVTRVGSVLRKTSIDEFPQFVNILRGEMSLVGPRNDIAGLGERLAESLPYYMARYVVKPGLTGWAQINQRYEPGNISPQSIEETKVRLAYDFYYIKHRSLGLDILIALRTIKRMLFRVSNW